MNLDEFLQDDDPNKWWRLSDGQRQNLFDEAMEVICEKDRKVNSIKQECIDGVEKGLQCVSQEWDDAKDLAISIMESIK